MSTEMATFAAMPPPVRLADAIEKALLKGDLSALTTEQRLDYLHSVCATLGLNPLTRPFDFLKGEGGVVSLYARADCAYQLARQHDVTTEIVSKEECGDLYIVHVRATLPAKKGGHKRSGENIGAVSLVSEKSGEPLRGTIKANAILKAVTKAMRRAILSACGMGILDEAEVETIPGATLVELQPIAEPLALPAKPAQAPVQAPAPAAAPATADQLNEVRALLGELQLTPEAWAQIRAPWGGRKPSEMSAIECADVILALRSRSVIDQVAAGMGGDGLPNLPPPPPMSTNGTGGAAHAAPAFPQR